MNKGKKLNCVVLLDDNEAHNYYHQFELQQANCTEEIAAFLNADEALAFFTKRHEAENIPDLLLLDYNMPDMLGVQFLEKLNQISDDFIENMTIIMLSASEINDEHELREKGVAEFKIKPIDQEGIQSILRQHF